MNRADYEVFFFFTGGDACFVLLLSLNKRIRLLRHLPQNLDHYLPWVQPFAGLAKFFCTCSVCWLTLVASIFVDVVGSVEIVVVGSALILAALYSQVQRGIWHTKLQHYYFNATIN